MPDVGGALFIYLKKVETYRVVTWAAGHGERKQARALLPVGPGVCMVKGTPRKIGDAEMIQGAVPCRVRSKKAWKRDRTG